MTSRVTLFYLSFYFEIIYLELLQRPTSDNLQQARAAYVARVRVRASKLLSARIGCQTVWFHYRGNVETNTRFEEEVVVNYADGYDGKISLLFETGLTRDYTSTPASLASLAAHKKPTLLSVL